MDDRHSYTGNFNGQMIAITQCISQVISGTERILSTVLDIEKSIFIFVFFINFPNTGTIKNKNTYHTNI